jgi:hypothetical protein
MTVETEVAALTSAVNLLTSTVNVSKATLDASVAAAEAAYDSFDDRYLGAKVSAPSLDNDGGSLLTGALYFNSTENAMYVYTGASWVITTNYNNVTAPYTLAQTLNTNGNNVTFGDSGKAIFGAGSDLQIYHDGSASYVTDTGTGDLILQGTNIQLRSASTKRVLQGIEAGATKIFYDNAEKLTTTSTGIDVTGTATMDGLTVQTAQGNISIPTNTSSLNFDRAGSNYIRATDVGGSFTFITGANDFATQRLNIASNGDVSFYEDTGTTPKLAWSAANERLTLTGSDYQFGIQQGANQPWYTRAVSDGTFRLHLNVTGDVLTADTSGNVGIGTSSPSALLEIQTVGTSGSQDFQIFSRGVSPNYEVFKISRAAGSTELLASQNLTLSADYDTNHTAGDSNVIFKTDNTERMRIDSSGNLLVGTPSARTGTNSLTFEPSNSFFMMRAAGTGTISQVAFVRDTAGTPAQVGDIATTGTATSYNTSSDQRLKENIADADDAGSKIDAIQVRQYDWKADGSHQDYGMVAQELLEVAPEAVSVPEDSEQMMGVDYSKLVPMLIKEIQSLRNRVAQLEGI